MSLNSSSRFVFPNNAGNMSKREKFRTAKYNSSINYLLSAMNIVDGELFGSQRYMNFTAPPKRNTSSGAKIDVAGILCRDSTNQYWLANPNTVTLDFTASGLNGCAVSSGNMTGTITAAGTAITGVGTAFLSELVVGDLVYVDASNVSRVQAIASDTACTLEKTITASGVTFKRGSVLLNFTSSGTAGWYVYVISNGQTTGLFASTRDVSSGHTLVDLPSGYTRYRQLPFYIINVVGSALLQYFSILGGWPYNPRVLYSDIDRVTTYGGVSASGSTGSQSVSLSPAIPLNASAAILNIEGSCASGTNRLQVGEANSIGPVITYATAGSGLILDTPVAVASGLITAAWLNSGTTPVTSIFPYGYVISKQF